MVPIAKAYSGAGLFFIPAASSGRMPNIAASRLSATRVFASILAPRIFNAMQINSRVLRCCQQCLL